MRKTLTTFLAAAIAFTQALPAQAFFEIPLTLPRALEINFPEQFDIPPAWGTIGEFSHGNSGDLVVLIQDAHAHYEAQKHIVRILEKLVGETGIALVGQEGGEGLVDTKLLRAFPLREVTREVLDRHMRIGEIGGPEFLATTSERPFDFVGIDQYTRYLKNLKEFVAVVNGNEKSLRALTSLKASLKNITGRSFSKALKDFDDLLLRWERHLVPPDVFINKLLEIAKGAGFNAEHYPTLGQLQMPSDPETFNNIRPEQFLREIEALSFALRFRLARTPLERELLHLDEYFTLLAHGFPLELSRSDVEKLRAYHKTWPQEKIAQTLKGAAETVRVSISNLNVLITQVRETTADVLAFYTTAEARDEILLRHMRREMRIRGAKKAAMVVGGFHREGITARLKKAGISYVVITPRLEKAGEQDRYRELMQIHARSLRLLDQDTLGVPIVQASPVLRTHELKTLLLEIVQAAKARTRNPAALARRFGENMFGADIVWLDGNTTASRADIVRAAERFLNRQRAIGTHTRDENRAALAGAVDSVSVPLPPELSTATQNFESAAQGFGVALTDEQEAQAKAYLQELETRISEEREESEAESAVLEKKIAILRYLLSGDEQASDVTRLLDLAWYHNRFAHFLQHASLDAALDFLVDPESYEKAEIAVRSITGHALVDHVVIHRDHISYYLYALAEDARTKKIDSDMVGLLTQIEERINGEWPAIALANLSKQLRGGETVVHLFREVHELFALFTITLPSASEAGFGTAYPAGMISGGRNAFSAVQSNTLLQQSNIAGVWISWLQSLASLFQVWPVVRRAIFDDAWWIYSLPIRTTRQALSLPAAWSRLGFQIPYQFFPFGGYGGINSHPVMNVVAITNASTSRIGNETSLNQTLANPAPPHTTAMVSSDVPTFSLRNGSNIYNLSGLKWMPRNVLPLQIIGRIAIFFINVNNLFHYIKYRLFELKDPIDFVSIGSMKNTPAPIKFQAGFGAGDSAAQSILKTNAIFLDFGGVVGAERGKDFAESVGAKLLKEVGIERRSLSETELDELEQLVVLPKGDPRRRLHKQPEAFDPWVRQIQTWLNEQGGKTRLTATRFKDLFFAGRALNPHLIEKLPELLLIKHALGIRFGILSNFELAGEDHLKKFLREKLQGLIDEDLIITSGRVGAVKDDGPAMFHAALRAFENLTGAKPQQVIFVDNDTKSFAGAHAAGITHLVHYAMESGKGAEFEAGAFFNAALWGRQGEAVQPFRQLLEAAHCNPAGYLDYFAGLLERMLADPKVTFNSKREIRDGQSRLARKLPELKNLLASGRFQEAYDELDRWESRMDSYYFFRRMLYGHNGAAKDKRVVRTAYEELKASVHSNAELVNALVQIGGAFSEGKAEVAADAFMKMSDFFRARRIDALRIFNAYLIQYPEHRPFWLGAQRVKPFLNMLRRETPQYYELFEDFRASLSVQDTRVTKTAAELSSLITGFIDELDQSVIVQGASAHGSIRGYITPASDSRQDFYFEHVTGLAAFAGDLFVAHLESETTFPPVFTRIRGNISPAEEKIANISAADLPQPIQRRFGLAGFGAEANLKDIPRATVALEDRDLTGKNVLIRVNINVSLDAHKQVSDDTRLRETVPVVSLILERGGTPVLIGHIGRAPESVSEEDTRFSVSALETSLRKIYDPLGANVKIHASSINEQGVLVSYRDIEKGAVNLLENVRYGPELATRDQRAAFAKSLTQLSNGIFIFDAFGDAASRGASVEDIPAFAQEVYAGPAMVREFEILGQVLEGFDALVFGGAKLEKVGFLSGLVARSLSSDGFVLMGSGPSATLNSGQDGLLEQLRAGKPERVLTAIDYSEPLTTFDIGPHTVMHYLGKLDTLQSDQTVLLNGTMGKVEDPKYASGTKAVLGKLEELARRGVRIVVVGGNASETTRAYGLDREPNVILFTGGSVPLKILAGEKLVGIEALRARSKALAGFGTVDILAQWVTETAGAQNGRVQIDAAIKVGANGVIVGHSEVRPGSNTPINDSQKRVHEQVKAAVARTAIRSIMLAVGEQHEPKNADAVAERDRLLERQIKSALKGIEPRRLIDRLVLTYEPRWAITGSGQGQVASPEYAQKAHQAIRRILQKMFGDSFAEHTLIIYGGSANAGNAKSLLEQEDIDGVMPGTASQRPDEFVAVVEIAKEITSAKYAQTGRGLYIVGNQKTYMPDGNMPAPSEFIPRLFAIQRSAQVRVGIAPMLVKLEAWGKYPQDGFGAGEGAAQQINQVAREQHIAQTVTNVLREEGAASMNELAQYDTLVISTEAALMKLEQRLSKFEPALRRRALAGFKHVVVGWEMSEGEKNPTWLRVAGLFSARVAKIYVGTDDRAVFQNIRSGAKAVLLGEETGRVLDKFEKDLLALDRAKRNGYQFVFQLAQALHLATLTREIIASAA